MKSMTYSEFRQQFPTVEQFRWAYGNLTEKKARALIDALQRKWRGMHLHGTHVVHEDYPGGIHRESRF